MKHNRGIAAEAVQVRLDDLQRKRGGNSGIEGVAAAFKHPHPHRARDPVRRCHDAERALDFWPRGEAVRIEAHDDTIPLLFVQRRERTTAAPQSRVFVRPPRSRVLKLGSASTCSIAVTMSAAARLFTLRTALRRIAYRCLHKWACEVKAPPTSGKTNPS